MTLDQAAEDLYDTMCSPLSGHPDWLQSLGAGNVAIHVYLVRRPKRHEFLIPDEWKGYQVKSKMVGRIGIGGRFG